MRSVETSFAFPLSSVKPLERLRAYRNHCIAATVKALGGGGTSRSVCAACGSGLELAGEVESLAYARCTGCSSLFLRDLPAHADWADLLRGVNGFKQSPAAFQHDIAPSRRENVFAPKLEWIEGVLRFQGLHAARLVEIATIPSEFSALLEGSRVFSSVSVLEESEVEDDERHDAFADAAVLVQSLDRSDDPNRLLRTVHGNLDAGGLVFVTAQVPSGFDMSTLGLGNMYLYPPDRANCFSLRGLQTLLDRAGFDLIEVSTPGVLDVEIVEAHIKEGVPLRLSSFESPLMSADREGKEALQTFLQQSRMSSFARIVGSKR